jgi:hypothetical protein
MYLVEIFLPLQDNEGKPFPEAMFSRVRKRLVTRFGGVTGYTRTPAQGSWKTKKKRISNDEIVIYEVMTPKLDAKWWSEFRRKLEIAFKQQEVLVRAGNVAVL